MTQEFSVIIEKDEDGYFVASVPALRGCHTQARSLDVLIKRIREAIALYLEVEEPVTSEFIGVQRVAVTAQAPRRHCSDRNERRYLYRPVLPLLGQYGESYRAG